MGFRIRGRIALASSIAALALGACCPKEGCIKDPPCGPRKVAAPTPPPPPPPPVPPPPAPKS